MLGHRMEQGAHAVTRMEVKEPAAGVMSFVPETHGERVEVGWQTSS